MLKHAIGWRAGRLLMVLLALGLVLPLYAATPSQAADDVPDDGSAPLVTKTAGKLSQRLAQLAGSALQTAGAAAQSRAVGLPARGPGSLLTSAQGELLVYIRVADTSAATLAALAQGGARIVHVAPAYRTVTAYVRADRLRALAALASVSNVREELQPKVAGRGIAQQQRAAAQTAATCPSGLVSEGDGQLKAAQARSALGVDGAGVTVGVLSDSYNVAVAATRAQDDVASGDLPGPGNPCGFTTPVYVLEEVNNDNGPGADEGRAMLQIVHDLAPASNLAVASAFNGLFSFADNIRALRRAGASVIVDDISYFAEPFFQDGPVNVAVKDVTSQGALYFTAAGNDDLADSAGNLVGSYEATYRPQPCVRVTDFDNKRVLPGKDCQNFDPKGKDTRQRVTVQPGGSFILLLQWAEPWYGVTTDFDLYLTDQSNRIVNGSDDTNTGANGSQLPVEFVSYENDTTKAQDLNIVIARYEGAGTPRVKYAFVSADKISATKFNATNSTDTFGPTIYGHAAESTAFSVAAVPFNDASTPEKYTSRGPATIYFDPVVDISPAAALAAPDVRTKPDLAATDGGRTTFFYRQYPEIDQFYRFFGTSAAAPHAAAIGALMVQQASKTSRFITRDTAARLLTTTAAPIANGVRENIGAGLVDASRAVADVSTLPQLRRVALLPLIQR